MRLHRIELERIILKHLLEPHALGPNSMVVEIAHDIEKAEAEAEAERAQPTAKEEQRRCERCEYVFAYILQRDSGRCPRCDYRHTTPMIPQEPDMVATAAGRLLAE